MAANKKNANKSTAENADATNLPNTSEVEAILKELETANPELVEAVGAILVKQQNEIASLSEANNTLAAELETAKEEIASQAAKKSGQAKHKFKATIEDSETENQGMEYEIQVPSFRFGGTHYNAAELAADKNLQQELLKVFWKDKDEATFNKNGILKIVYS